MKTNNVRLALLLALSLVVVLVGTSSVSLAATKPKPAVVKKVVRPPLALVPRPLPAVTTVSARIKITAKQFEFSPNKIELKKDQLTLLGLTTLDVLHGFNCPELGLRTDIKPGKVTILKVIPGKTGTFAFYCDVNCGEGHGKMTGTIVVVE